MKRPLSILVLIFVMASSAFSLGLESLDVKGGIIWIGNAAVDPAGTDAAPDPITTIIGVSLPIRLAPIFLIVPELRYFGGPYGIEYGRAVPVEVEYPDATWVIGLLVEPRVVLDFPLHPSLNLGAYVSPTVLARIPSFTWGTVDSGAVASYQYDQYRFFYPEAGLYLDWKIPSNTRSLEAEALNEGEFEEDEEQGMDIRLVVDLNSYFPLFHAWDGEDVPFWDQFMVSGTIGLKFGF